MFNTVKFTKPGARVVSTNMTAIVDGIPQASFVMSTIVGSIQLPNTIDYRETLKLGHNKIELLEHKPATKEVACQ